MPSHPIDFHLQANFYVTRELKDIFDEKRKMDRWLQIEGALARVQGELGLIPAEAAQEISEKASLAKLDLDQIREGYTRSRNSLMPVVKALRKACRGDLGQFVHYGATTQDILDTAQTLEIQYTLQIMYRDLRKLEQLLVNISSEHKETAMIGRTHGQQALPITFGLKSVGWAMEVRRQIERAKAIYPRVTVGQMGGAVGTMAALGPQAMEVAKKTMAMLDLSWKPPGWHTARDNNAEFASNCAILAGTLERIANEIFLLGKTEVNELAEPAPDSMMSSTMPHKQNPVLCQRVAVLARHIRSLGATVVESMAHEHERDPRLLWSEWLAIPQICMYSGTALQYLARVLDGLVVRRENMRKNLLLHKDMVMSEWLLFRLAPDMGKMQAQEKLHTIMRRAAEGKSSLQELLLQDREIGSLLKDTDMEMLDHPERYTGRAVELVEETLAEIASLRKNDNESLTR